MGPPREHGGMPDVPVVTDAPESPLQWGRRVNTAEWLFSKRAADLPQLASMGPPREHGGMS